MNELEGIRVFMQVVEDGSFSSAGRNLGKSASAVARQIQWLEDSLGVRLLHRNTRNQSLTEVGRVYHDRVKAISRQLQDAMVETRSAHESVEGTLRVSLRTSVGSTVIIRALPRLMEQYPGLKLDIEITDERRDLLARNIDVAVWHGDLPDSGLVARLLSPSHRIVCAAPAYLERHGEPTHPRDLRNHRCLLYRAPNYGNEWAFARGEERLSVAVESVLASDSVPLLMTAVAQGMGVLMLQSYLVRDQIEDGRLRQVLTDYSVGPAQVAGPLYVVFPSSRSMSKRVRLFIDFLVDLFAEEPPAP